MDKPTRMYNAYFKHIYLTKGFSISKAVIEGDEDYQPEGIHACLASGYWCWSNAWTHPRQIKLYLSRKLDHGLYKIGRFLDKVFTEWYY